MKFKTFSDMKFMFFQHENKKKYWRIFAIRTVGNVLILGSLLFVASQFYPVIAAEIGYRWETMYGTRQYDQSQFSAQTVPDTPILDGSPMPIASASAKPLPALSVEPVDKEFGLVIEKINANTSVVPNVDPYSSQTYDSALKKGVAHAKETRYPGEPGNVYLFAHNTLNAWDIPKYNAVFFLLHNLTPGDRISTFYKGVRYDYIVFDKQVHSAKDLAPLTNQYIEPILSLQTCWPPGTTWQRLVVRAKLDR
jgi:sortase A